MNTFNVVLFIVAAWLSAVNCRKIPSFVELCHRSDSIKINDCIRKAVEAIRPHMKKGVPDLFIPPMDPLILPEASLDSGDSFRATFKNIEVYYGDEFVMNDIDVKFGDDEIKLRLDLGIARLRIKSQYNIKGKLLIINLDGQGPADGNFTDVKAKISGTGTRVMKNGKEYITFKDRQVDLDLGKPIFKFDNLFKDNVELNDQTNKIVNDNIDQIIDELKPVIHETVTQLVLGIVLKVLETYSLDELFPK